MPHPGSYHYDIERTRRRADAEGRGVPDQHADRVANEELQREYPPVAVPPRPGESLDRAGGPEGTGGTSRGDPSIDEPQPPPPGGIELRSAALHDHTLIPERFSADGGNVSPPLERSAAPDGNDAHRYFFRLYAVDRALHLGEGCAAADLRDALNGHELATGSLVGLFQR